MRLSRILVAEGLLQNSKFYIFHLHSNGDISPIAGPFSSSRDAWRDTLQWDSSSRKNFVVGWVALPGGVQPVSAHGDFLGEFIPEKKIFSSTAEDIWGLKTAGKRAMEENSSRFWYSEGFDDGRKNHDIKPPTGQFSVYKKDYMSGYAQGGLQAEDERNYRDQGRWAQKKTPR